MNDDAFHCGSLAIVGRPNVGKSTLMNHLLGQKISITSRKPQTTRHRLLGIKTTASYQCIFIDTPGIHLRADRAMNRYMNRTANSSLVDVDAVLFVIEAGRWNEEDENVRARLQSVRTQPLLIVNKIDRIKQAGQLLPILQQLSMKMECRDIFPISALRGSNMQALEEALPRYLPAMPPIFAADQITDRSERFLAAEIVREKLTRKLGQELPYAISVEIEEFREEQKKDLRHIAALIWVERESQKGIVIGKGGEMLREIGRTARLDMERLFGSKVFLRLWVKVKEGWSDNERALCSLGYKP